MENPGTDSITLADFNFGTRFDYLINYNVIITILVNIKKIILLEKYILPGGQSVFAGLYNDKNSAEKAYFDLKEHGYLASEINLLMSKETHFQYYSDNLHRKKFRKNLTQKDLIQGGIADDISSFGTNLKIPWPGLVVSGPLENNFNIQEEKGSFTIADAISKAGIPKDEMVYYIEGLVNGKILITINSHSDHRHHSLTEKWKNTMLQKA